MRNPKFTLTAICSLLLSTITIAQTQSKIILPLKDNVITYEGNIKMNKNFASDYLCSKIKSWIIAASDNLDYKVSEIKDDGCSIVLNMSTIVEKDGTFTDVDCNYTMTVVLHNEKITYTINKLYLNKSGHSYNASEVYERYYKQDPYIKQTIEVKQAALRRHEYILQKLNAKMYTISNSLAKFLVDHDVAVK